MFPHHKSEFILGSPYIMPQKNFSRSRMFMTDGPNSGGSFSLEKKILVFHKENVLKDLSWHIDTISSFFQTKDTKIVSHF